ncbi:hypothetical protein GW17_00046722 [Ensete ventricosum]|nr:hypothetical protein GW17_00046722 [Ensete ventricosum]
MEAAAEVGAGKEDKRRRKKSWAKIEVPGGGGILILGGVLIAAAVGAGTAFVARRAQRRRSSTTAKPADDENDSASKPPTSKNPDVGGTEDTILEDDTHNDGCGSIEQTSEESEFVLVNGTGEGSEQMLEKPDLLVGEEIPSTETLLDVSQQPTEQPLHESEITFAHEEEEDDGASSMESKHGMNYHQVELARDDEEKEDEASLKEGAQLNMTELDEASTDSQFDQVNREDEADSVLAEKIRGEVEVLLIESRIEMTEFSAVKDIDEQEEEEEEASSTAIIVEETKPQLEMSQQQTEQAMDEPKIILVDEEIDDKKAMSSESESGMNDHQTELVYDNEAEEENESGLHQTQPGVIECCSADVRGESMLEQMYKGSELSTMKDINEMEEVSSTGSQDIAGSSAEEEEEAEMREEGSDSTGVSSTESNADAIWPAEVIEQEKILRAVEAVADTVDQLETWAETKNMIHVEEEEEEEEEEQQKEIILVKQATVDDVMATDLTTEKEKLPMMDWISMNSPTRLFLLVAVMAFILGFLSFVDHFIKLSSRLYQILSPSSENRQEL